MKANRAKSIFAIFGYAAVVTTIAVCVAVGLEYLLLEPEAFAAHWLNVVIVSGSIAFVLSVATVWQFRWFLAHWRELRHASTHDFLTGAGNRAYFFDVLQVRETSHVGAVLLTCDIDEFKQVNDRFGHQAGDEVLVELVRRFHAIVADGAVVTRFGGDEFVIYVPATVVRVKVPNHSDVEGYAASCAEALRRGIAERPVQTARGIVPVYLSLGLAVGCEEEALEDLFRRADNALYAAKRAGGDRCVRWDPALDGALQDEGAEGMPVRAGRRNGDAGSRAIVSNPE